MNTLFVLMFASETPAASLIPGYIVGAIIGVIILAYLVYTLVKPEKF